MREITDLMRRDQPKKDDGGSMLWTIFVIILVLWVLGFSLHIAGGLIHLLLVLALIVLVINLVSGRRSAL
jgi:fatty acid desaturase